MGKQWGSFDIAIGMARASKWDHNRERNRYLQSQWTACTYQKLTLQNFRIIQQPHCTFVCILLSLRRYKWHNFTETNDCNVYVELPVKRPMLQKKKNCYEFIYTSNCHSFYQETQGHAMLILTQINPCRGGGSTPSRGFSHIA